MIQINLLMISLILIPTFGLGATSDDKLKIKADHAEIDGSGRVTFIGNVKFSTKSMSMVSSKVMVYFNKDKTIKEIIAIGDVKLKSATQEAYGDEAYYRLVDEKMLIKGNARLIGEKANIQGESIVYDFKNKKVNVINSENSSPANGKDVARPTIIINLDDDNSGK
ncbi:MAG: LptA/OstA family protein [Nitrospinota bacterium]